ncbi:MAG: protein-export membrane protein SecD [Chloroflexi bacterium RBG_16_48_8]|nr:MAG: protein-export membrane protein SecD [Chloroflexi bacterium RBG_16_48_8]
MRHGYLRWLIPILLIVTAAIWVVNPNNPGISIGSFAKEIKVVRGLDLQGGLRVLLEADLPQDVDVTSEQMNTAKEIIENRVNGLGVTEPVIQVAGNRRVLVELPGIGDPEVAVAIIKETGLLEFVEMGSLSRDEILLLQGQTIETDFETSEESSTESFPWPTTEEATEEVIDPLTTIYHTVMTGAVLEDAGVTRSQTGELSVGFILTDDGKDTFGSYTSDHIGQFLAIVLDKKVISIPRIESAITTGQGSISGSFTYEEANNLAIQLRYGALPIPLKVVESKSVGPTLGQDSLEKSTVAGVIGFSVVILFMAFYYRLPGILADIALLIYASITFALFKFIPVTLTLPGIAGFVLSIGVAVDANILIFERMKEELRSGRTLQQAIDLGFSRAWPSIRDSNLSTLITCAILYWFGNTFGASIVKGFSLTLALGVMVSLFTAITVTRTFLHVVLDRIKLTEHPQWFGV